MGRVTSGILGAPSLKEKLCIIFTKPELINPKPELINPKYLQRDREDTENKKQVVGEERVRGSQIKNKYATMDKDLKK